MSILKVIAAVKKNKRFLVTSHMNLEGDALGSELAFSRLIRALGKESVVVNEDNPLPQEYNFMPDFEEIKTFDKKSLRIKFDCLVALDCSDLGRAGEVRNLHRPNVTVINIDHHVSNVEFGDVNWVNSSASSASEMVYLLYKKMKVEIDRETASLLYTGIMTDTGSFRYSNTSALTHKIVADLLKYKFDVPQIYRHVYEDQPYEDMCLVAKVLHTMQRQAQGKVVWFAIRKQLLRKHKVMSFDLSDHILSFARSIRGVEVCALFKENLGIKDEIRVNLRSQGRVDVNKIAASFGGGGHKTASGITIKGKLDTVRKAVLKKIRESL